MVSIQDQFDATGAILSSQGQSGSELAADVNKDGVGRAGSVEISSLC